MSHFTDEQRYTNDELLELKKGKSDIERFINKDKSVNTSEIKHNYDFKRQI